MRICYWDDWNKDHLIKHHVTPNEAQQVIHRARPPYPEAIGYDKYAVRGRTEAGRYIQVVFVYRSWEEIKFEELSIEEITRMESVSGPFVYVIHAMELELGKKRRDRRRTK